MKNEQHLKTSARKSSEWKPNYFQSRLKTADFVFWSGQLNMIPVSDNICGQNWEGVVLVK